MIPPARRPPPKPTDRNFPAVPPPPIQRARPPAIELDPIVSAQPMFGDAERDTGRTNAALASYQPIVATFDEMSPSRRLAFVELARAFVELDDTDALSVIALASRLAMR